MEFFITGNKYERLNNLLNLKNNDLATSKDLKGKIELFLMNIPEYNKNNKQQDERVYEIYEWYTNNLSAILK